MADLNLAAGRCLCGATRFTARSAGGSVGACHCQMCRKWGGGPLLAVDCGTDVSFEGEENISVFNSSEWAERGFCSKCGTHLFYRLKDSQQYFIPVGLFDDDRPFTFDHQVYIDKKPSYYCFANATQTMTEAEAIAAYAPQTE